MGKSVMTPEKRDQLKKINEERKKVEEVSALPVWAKMALARRALAGFSLRQAAKQSGKSHENLRKYAQSPAAKEWEATLRDLAEDPMRVADLMLKEAAAEVTADRFLIFEAAKDLGDWKLADTIAKDLQDRMGIVAKRSSEDQKIELRISLGGVPLDVPSIEAEYEIVGDAGDE